MFLVKSFLTLVLATFLTNVGATRCSIRKLPRLLTINPPTLVDPTPLGYSHISVDTKNLIATVAGQVAVNKTGDVVGSTFAEQLASVEQSLVFAIKAVDANLDDVFKSNFYIANFNASADLGLVSALNRRLGLPPGALVPVPRSMSGFGMSTALDELLVKIEISVVVSKRFVRKKACGLASRK